MPSGSNHYDNLEIRADATSAEIRHAYERQRERLHVWPHRTHEWRIRQREIETAYQVLSDPASRQFYDRMHLGNGPDDASPGSGQDEAANTASHRLPPNEPDFPGLRTSAAQTWMLSRAQDTPRGYEIVLEQSSANPSQVVRALQQRIPAQELQFDAVRQIWLVPHAYAADLEKLFVNFPTVLRHSRDRPGGLVLPPYGTDKPATPVSAARKTYRHDQPGEVFAASPFPVQGTIIVVLVLLIGWNFFVSREDQEQEAVAALPTPRATRTPIVTPTHTPTVTPTPFSFVTTTKYPRVHLRRLPDPNAPSLGYLEAQDSFTVLARTPDSSWVQVQHGEATGWSASWTLNVEESMEQLPILLVPPHEASPQR